MKSKPFIHPNTPRKLAAAIRLHKSQHKIARALGVNPYYVNRWMKYGEEPRNADVRKRMGFRPLRKKHNGRSGFAELPAHVQWWRKLPKGERDQWIRSSHEVHRAKERRW